ncbi:MAG: DUF2066 domain-containing protein [Luminiphilus sp.]|nr:DUF2066 domain-containing protein [Luminiphilus sp.]MDG2136243.1 DUF2066 domain-containing protein [Luminiphilus sp.]
MLLTRSHCESYVHRQRWALKALNGLVMWVMLSLNATSPAHGSSGEELIIRIEVADRSEATIDTAAREALVRALLQRSGDRDLLEHPVVQAALASARAQLSLFQFERVQGSTRFVAHIDQTALEQLIREANGTLWAELRPPILLWLVVDEKDGRRFGNQTEEEALWESMTEEFDALGLNLRRPLYDLTDSLSVSPEALWQRDFDAIIEASGRYGMTHLLVGRLIRLSEGRYIAEWIYSDGTDERFSTVQADSVASVIDPGVRLATAEMQLRYAVELTGAATQRSLIISVRNVISLEDYKAVTRAMTSIQTLERVRPLSVDGDMLVLEVFGISEPETLMRLMASLQDLQWLTSDPERGLELVWRDS